MARSTAREYCSSTTIHGFVYLAVRRNLCEAVFWALTIATGLTLAAFLIDESLR